MVDFTQSYCFFVGIAVLFVLLVLGYLYFRIKLKKQNSLFEEKLSKAQKIEQNKTMLLSELGDNIYKLTQHLVKSEADKGVEEEILHTSNNLRELLKIESHQVEVYHEMFTLSSLLDDLSTYLASNFNARDTEVVFMIDRQVSDTLYGDANHLSRIINNLLEFSVQATPQGKVSLSIKSKKNSAKKMFLDIQIKDTGKSYSENEIEKLFELCYDDKKNEYVGLRLYIAKKLTLAIGGKIHFHSSLAAGNTFVLEIPVEVDKNALVHTVKTISKNRSDEKVLIYSDKVATGIALEKLFSLFYQKVKSVTYEEIRQKSIQLSHFDVLVLDSCFFNDENVRALEAIKRTKETYIVAFSSIFKDFSYKQFGVIDSYMKTPSNRERIADIVQKIGLKKSSHEENIDISSSGKDKSFVHKDPIEETRNVDLDNFTYFRGIRLLIVEDNLINQKIILSVLQKSGMEIEIANNGQEALNLLFVEKKKYDIILMDISMPVMDGIVATKRIRENKKFDTIPIITFTAFAMGVEIEQMFKAGCNAYLTKPLNIKKLYSAFKMFLVPTNREVSRNKIIEIDGLDTTKGITRADNDEMLYRETLKEFIFAHQDKTYFIPKWIKEKNFKRIRLSCSEMQGILDAIGAYEMKALVDEMQKHFVYEKEVFLDQYSKRYVQTLNKLIDTIQFYLQG